MEIQRVTRYLDSAMVEEAYRNGIFPMADPDLRLVTWHRPRRRAILPLDSFHVSRSLQRRLRRGGFEVTFDQDFGGVMAGCAQRSPTWISEEFRAVYGAMHRACASAALRCSKYNASPTIWRNSACWRFRTRSIWDACSLRWK